MLEINRGEKSGTTFSRCFLDQVRSDLEAIVTSTQVRRSSPYVQFIAVVVPRLQQGTKSPLPEIEAAAPPPVML